MTRCCTALSRSSNRQHSSCNYPHCRVLLTMVWLHQDSCPCLVRLYSSMDCDTIPITQYWLYYRIRSAKHCNTSLVRSPSPHGFEQADQSVVFQTLQHAVRAAMHAHTLTCSRTRMRMRTRPRACMHACLFVWHGACVCVLVYVHMCVCAYVCTCAYVRQSVVARVLNVCVHV